MPPGAESFHIEAVIPAKNVFEVELYHSKRDTENDDAVRGTGTAPLPWGGGGSGFNKKTSHRGLWALRHIERAAKRLKIGGAGACSDFVHLDVGLVRT